MDVPTGAKAGEAVPRTYSEFLVPVVSPGPAPRVPRVLRERLLTVAQLADALGVCRATIYKLCERGEMAHVRVSNSIRFEPGAVEAFISTRHRKGDVALDSAVPTLPPNG